MNKLWLQQYSRLMEGEPEGGGTGDPVLPEPDSKDVELEQLKTRLSRAEQALQSRPVPETPQTTHQPEQDPRKNLEKEYWRDPVSFIAKHGQWVAQQTIAQLAPTLEQSAKDKVRAADPELFDALTTNIESNMQGVDPQLRVNTTVWQNAFNLAKGQNIDKVLELKGKRATTVNDGPAAVTPRTPPAPRKETLSEDEQTFIKKFKVTEDQYRRGKEFIDNPDKMWEQVITFDSMNSRRTVDAKSK